MKGTSLCGVTGLFLVASVHGFIAPSCARSALRASSSYCNGFLAGTQEAYGRVTESRNHARGVRPLSMTKPNFTKTLGTVLIVGSTIGVSAIPFLSLGPQQQSKGPKTVRVVDEDGNTSERGILTAMTRPEIQKKLSQIPVFFLRDESGAVHVENGEGLFFMSPGDAKEKLQDLKGAEGTKVAATTLDDIWYPLVKKKGPNKKPVAAGASGLSDLSARYRIIPRSNQVAQALEVHSGLERRGGCGRRAGVGSGDPRLQGDGEQDEAAPVHQCGRPDDQLGQVGDGRRVRSEGSDDSSVIHRSYHRHDAAWWGRPEKSGVLRRHGRDRAGGKALVGKKCRHVLSYLQYLGRE